MNSPYQLTGGAADDLENIVAHTTSRWGAEQCRRYVAQLEDAACQLSHGQGNIKTLDDVLPGLRVKLAGHHYLFCLPRLNQPALILAILHERMDLMARLRQRLGQ